LSRLSSFSSIFERIFSASLRASSLVSLMMPEA
jgi:hypothetical protein